MACNQWNRHFKNQWKLRSILCLKCKVVLGTLFFDTNKQHVVNLPCSPIFPAILGSCSMGCQATLPKNWLRRRLQTEQIVRNLSPFWYLTKSIINRLVKFLAWECLIFFGRPPFPLHLLSITESAPLLNVLHGHKLYVRKHRILPRKHTV